MPKAARPADSQTRNGTANAVASPNGNTVRTTLILPELLDWNLAAWCLANRVRKNEGIVKILTQFLGSEGLQPNRTPEIKIGY